MIRETPMYQDDRALATWLRAELEAERERSRRHRPYLSERVWSVILERFGRACAYCGATGVDLQREHVTPYSKGGATDESNIVPACKPCNARKFDATWPVVWP